MRRSETCQQALPEQRLTAALEVCDRFVAIRRGRIVHAGQSASEGDRSRLMEAIAVQMARSR